jgi:K+-sensing histidine kinase KdpD
MDIKNSRSWAPINSATYRYVFLGTLTALFVRYELHPLLQAQFPVLFFLFNSTLIAYKFGWKAASFSAILGLVFAYYFFIPPFNSFELPTFLDLLNLVFFGILFFTIIYLIEKLQRERYKAILVSRVSESRMEIMAKLSKSRAKSD